MKVLLIQPPFASLQEMEDIFEQRNFRSFGVKRINFPLGLLHVGSVLKKNNTDTKIVDLARHLFYFVNDESIREKGVEQFFNRYLIENIRRYQPDIIGISGNFNTNAKFIERCCREIKKFDKNLAIVLGGHYFTNSYKEVFTKNSDVDYVILGEGEEVMLDIVHAVGNKRENSLGGHPHIVTRQNILNDSLADKRPAMVADLESLPPIDYSIMEDIEDYLTSKHDMRTIVTRDVPIKAIGMMTSRGCPHSCTYCASHQVHGKKMRAFSVDRIVDELAELVERYDINTIVFEDDLFTYSRKRTIELCQKICGRFGDRFLFDFPNGIAVYTLNEEVIFWLAKAGMKQINLAIESGNQYVQNEVIKKRIKLEKVRPVVDLLKKYGVLVRAYFIIGFPGETLDMMRDTRNFAKELKLDWSVFSFATPIVGSELYQTAMRDNRLVSEDMDISTYFDFRLRSDDWEPADVVQMQEEANFEVNFLENYNLVEGNYEKSCLIFGDIVNDYPKHLLANYCLWKSQMGLGDSAGVKATEKRLYEIVRADEQHRALLTKYNLLQEEPFVRLLADDALVGRG